MKYCLLFYVSTLISTIFSKSTASNKQEATNEYESPFAALQKIVQNSKHIQKTIELSCFY